MKNGSIFKAFLFGFILNLTIFGMGYGLICAADVELILGTSSGFRIVRGTSVSAGTSTFFVGSSTVSIGTTTQAAMLTIAGSSTSGNDASLRVRNSSGADTLSVRNDGAILIGTNTSTLNSALYVGSATSGSLGTITAGFLSMGTISANAGLHGTTTVRFLADIFANGTITTGTKFVGDGSSLTGITATSLGSTSNINTTGTINAGSTTVSVLTTTGSATVTGTLTAANNTFTVNGNTGSMTASSITVSTGTLTVASGAFKVDETGSMTVARVTASSMTVTTGTLTAANGAFKVDENGSMTASRITSTGAFTAGSGNFAVDATGTLTAQRITVSSGTVTAKFLSVGTVSTSADGTTTVRFLNDIFANGTITTGTKFVGDGSLLTGITATGGVTGGNISTSGTISAGSTTVSTLTTTGSATVSNTLTAASNTFRADSGSVTVTTRVGIGTSTPSSSYMLQITDSADLGVVVGSSGSITAKTITATGSITVSSNGTITAGFLSIGTVSASTTGHGTTTVHFLNDIFANGAVTASTLSIAGTATIATTSGANVGIGTTGPGSTLPNGFTSSSQSRILQISSGGTGASADVGLAIRRSDDALGLDIWNDATGGESFIDDRIDSTAGKIHFRTRAAGTAVEMLTILGTGLVGIKQTTPTAILHLTGPATNTDVSLKIDSNMINGALNVMEVRSDVSGADDLIFRITATGTVFADGAYTGTGADYAEWFEKEGELKPKDLVGLNLATGKVRKYQTKDLLVGVYAEKPGFVGNQPLEISEAEMSANHALVSLLGQVEVAQEQISLQDRIVYTLDGIQLGYLLANGKVFIKISL